MKAIGYVMFAIVFAVTAFLTIDITAIILRAIFGKPETWHRRDDDLGPDDPGVDVDAEPINGDGTPIHEDLMEPAIESMELTCVPCGTRHLDTDEWYDKPHRTHLCLECGHTWRPFEHFTRGV